MNRKQQLEATNAILADIFKHGGPQRPSYANGVRTPKQPARKHEECPALLAEQQRLIKTWRDK